jgi:hypothetical protein
MKEGNLYQVFKEDPVATRNFKLTHFPNKCNSPPARQNVSLEAIVIHFITSNFEQFAVSACQISESKRFCWFVEIFFLNENLLPVMSHFNPVCDLTRHAFKISFKIILQYKNRATEWPLLLFQL